VADSADRVVVMYAGRNVETAGVREIFRTPQHPYTAGLLGAAPFPGSRAAERLQEIPGTVPTLTEPARLCSFAPRCGNRGERCAAELPALLDRDAGHLAACWYPVSTKRGA